MPTQDLKQTIASLYTCLCMHTIFHFSPSSKFHMNTPVYNEELESCMRGYMFHHGAHLANCVGFQFPDEIADMIQATQSDIISGKKYLIPGYLSSTIKSCVKKLLTSPERDLYDFVGYVSGLVVWMPDNDSLKKDIYKIAESYGYKRINRMY